MQDQQRNVVIRADASAHMGAGHVMRCLALAQELVRCGWRVTFACYDLTPEIASRLQNEGGRLRPVRGVHPDPCDLEDVLALGGVGDWVVLDGYHFDGTYLQALKRAGRRVLVVDDMADRGQLECDILVNQNIHAQAYKYDLPDTCLRLLGSEYVLLRKEFLSSTPQYRKRGEARILVTLGGADPSETTELVLASAALLERRDVAFYVVVGPANPRLQRIRTLAAACKSSVHILESVSDMGVLMEGMDLAVTAAGSTCWELAYKGVPMLAITVADNQQGIASGLAAVGAAVDMGDVESLDATALAAALEAVLSKPGELESMSEAGKKVVDGRGVERIACVMAAKGAQKLDVTPFLRPVEARDCRAVWELSNDPAVRASSFSRQLISWEEHQDWFAELMLREDSILYVADVGGVLAGQIRFDQVAATGTISFSVAAGFRGRGLGESLLIAGSQCACRVLALERVRGLVIDGNVASEKCFQRAGFVKTEARPEVQGYLCTEYELRCM